MRLFTGIMCMMITTLLMSKAVFAQEKSVTVKNRRGDLLCEKSGAVIESSDTVFFYLNGSYLSENEIFVSSMSFDGGETYGALMEVTDFTEAATPQEGQDTIVRFYICMEGGGADMQVRNPSDGEQIYTVKYTEKKAESILAELNGNAAGWKDGTEYYSGSMPLLKIYPSDTRDIYVTVDDGREAKEYTVRDRQLSVKLTEGTYKLDVFALADGGRLHAQGFPRTVCYDAKAPAAPSFIIHMPEDGGYYPELKKCQYYASGSLTVSVRSTDKGSGIDRIYMRLGNGETRETDTVQIMAPFSDTVYARSVDKAGNASPWVQCAEKIRVESRAPEIAFQVEKKEGKICVSGKVTDDSGIREAEIACDGESLFSYRFENGKQLFREKEFSFSCPAGDGRYKERKIRVTSTDIAGNYSEKQITAGQRDVVPPLISMEGCNDYDVINDDVCLRFFVTDDNLKSSAPAGEAVRADADGKAMETVPLTFPETVFTKEGDYSVTVRAEDTFGNKAQRTWKFRIDKTAPVIRGLKEYDGKTLKAFRLAGGTDSLVSDMSGITYRIYLNGKDFDENSVVNEPGKYVLRVTAEDEAGNSSAEQAQFTIEQNESGKPAGEDRSVLHVLASDERKTVTAQNGNTTGESGTGREHPAAESTEKEGRAGKTENTYANMVPFAAAGIMFLILSGVALYFVRNANLTQNTGCDRLDI